MDLEILTPTLIIVLSALVWVAGYIYFKETDRVDPKTTVIPVSKRQPFFSEFLETVMDQNLNLAKLKIKAKSLAEEARIIRREERKFSGWQRASLNEHRRGIVRDEARATYLTIALIKGVPYRVLEAKCHDLTYRDVYIAAKMVAMLKKYHEGIRSADQVHDWFYERGEYDATGGVPRGSQGPVGRDTGLTPGVGVAAGGAGGC